MSLPSPLPQRRPLIPPWEMAEMSCRKTTADRLLGQIYLWIFRAQQWALVLQKEASEMEAASKQGRGLSTGQKIALGFLMNPFGLALGSALFAVTSLVFGAFASSVTVRDELKKDENKGQKCWKIGEKVQQLNVKLRSESQCKNSKDVDRYVLFELLKSLGKSEGLTDPRSTSAIEQLMDDHLKSQKSSVFSDAMAQLLGVLQFFNINILTANQSAVKQDAEMAGGLALLGSSLPAAFGNCQKAIEKNDGTKAAQILRDISGLILEATEKVLEMAYEAESLLAQAVQSQTGQKHQRDQSKWRESGGGGAVGGVSGGAGGGRGGGGGGGRRHKDEEDSCEDESSDSDKKQLRQKRKKLRMALLNVHSVSKKSIKKGHLLRKLILDHNLDFFLITETWLKPGQEGDEVLSSLLPSNQNFIHQPRGFGRGGGVAIVYSDQFQCRPVTLPHINTFECVAGSVQHKTWDRPVLIITLYHRSARNKDEFSKFMTEFTRLLKIMSSDYSSIIVAGDFNIWIDDEKRRPVQEFLEFLKKNNLDQFVHEPTHRRGHTLDLVIGREMDITNVIVQDDDISDHWTVYFNATPKEQKKDGQKTRIINDEL